MRIKNKRGQEVLSDFMGYILLIMITVLFFIWVTWSSNVNNQTSIISINSNYAKTQILFFLHEDYYQTSQTYAESIILNEDNPTFIKQEIKPVLDTMLDENIGENLWQYSIILNSDVIEEGKNPNSGKSWVDTSVYLPNGKTDTIYLPSMFGNNIKIEIMTWSELR